MSETPHGDGWWEASNGKFYPPELRGDHRPPPPPADLARASWDSPSVGVSPAASTLVVQSRKRRRWPWVVVLLALLAGGAVGLVTVVGGEDSEDAYLAALDSADLNSWSTERAAVNAGYAVCEQLDQGGPTRGSDADLTAVQHLCPDYEDAFRVLERAEIEGTFTVFDSDEWGLDDEGDACFPAGGYGDINASTQVVVRNSAGDELARTSLGSGQIGLLQGCEFSFTLSLTEGEQVYITEVGDRGEISYTWDEVSQPGAIALSLGDILD